MDAGGGEEQSTTLPSDASNTVTPDSSGAVTGDAPPLLNTEGAPSPNVTSTAATTTAVVSGGAPVTAGE